MAEPLAGISALVVDDDDARELMEIVLREVGATVRSASSATEALELIKAAVPAVVVADIAMPQRDGTVARERGGNQPAGRRPRPERLTVPWLMRSASAPSLFVLPDPVTLQERRRIVDLAAKHRLPAIKEFVLPDPAN